MTNRAMLAKSDARIAILTGKSPFAPKSSSITPDIASGDDEGAISSPLDYASIKRTAGYFARYAPSGSLLDKNDFAQESALRALLGRKSRDGPMYDLLRRQGWITNHRAGSIHRRVTLDERQHTTSPEAQWIAAIDVLGLLARLTPYQRRAVELHYLYGMRESEIVDVLHISTNAVRNRIHEGLKNMRRMVQ